MIVKNGILCEILFVDNKSGAPTSSIGRLEEYQLEEFDEENQSNFICFVDSYIPPVLKANIEEIIVYSNDEGVSYPVEHGKLSFAVIDSKITKAKIKTEAEVS